MKKAIIIGASSGIGREVASDFIRKGWRVGLIARRGALLADLRSIATERVSIVSCDINSDKADDKLFSLIEELGGLDLYFHAAGIGRQNPLLDAQIEKDTLATNVLGFSRMIGLVFRYMADHGGGHIAVISSIAGVKGLAPAPSYSASKAFQSIYVQALEQLSVSRQLCIRFTDIRPGFVDTPLIAGSDFPMKMSSKVVARKIIDAIEKQKHVVIIDWRYRLLVFVWRLFPNCLWRRLPLRARR